MPFNLSWYLVLLMSFNFTNLACWMHSEFVSSICESWPIYDVTCYDGVDSQHTSRRSTSSQTSLTLHVFDSQPCQVWFPNWTMWNELADQTHSIVDPQVSPDEYIALVGVVVQSLLCLPSCSLVSHPNRYACSTMILSTIQLPWWLWWLIIEVTFNWT